MAFLFLEEIIIVFLKYKSKKELNIKPEVRYLEIENVVQFDIFTDLRDKLILGKVKRRADTKTLKELEKSIERLLKVITEFRRKKIIPMIYAKKATEELIEERERKGLILS